MKFRFIDYFRDEVVPVKSRVRYSVQTKEISRLID